MFERAVTVNTPGAQKHILTGVAAANGIVIGLGLAPMSTIAAELVPLSPIVQLEYVGVVSAIVQVGTVLELLFGVFRMVEGSGWVGVLAFLGAFIGGTLLPYQETIGAAAILIYLCMMVVEVSPSNFRMSR